MPELSLKAGLLCVLCFSVTWVYLHVSFPYLFIHPLFPVMPSASPLSKDSWGVILPLICQCQATDTLNSDTLNSVTKAAAAWDMASARSVSHTCNFLQLLQVHCQVPWGPGLPSPGPRLRADEAVTQAHTGSNCEGPAPAGCESSLTPGVVFVTAALLTPEQTLRPGGAP